MSIMMMDASLALVFGSTPYTFPACMATAYDCTSNTTLGFSADLALTDLVLFNQMGIVDGICPKLNSTNVCRCRAAVRVQQQQEQQGSSSIATAGQQQGGSRAAAGQQRVGTVVEVGVRVGELHRDGVGQGEHKDVEEAGQVGPGVLGRYPHGVHHLPACTHTHTHYDPPVCTHCMVPLYAQTV